MTDLFKKIFMTGIGAVALTTEKAGEMIDELVKRGEITLDQGKEMAKEYKDKFDAQRAEFDGKMEGKIKDILKSMDIVTKEELKDILDRLAALEAEKAPAQAPAETTEQNF